jgi:3-deoxy-D-manno-octulosonate 8-phosphate phosphatase (KDO 8-P phosphatase)
MTSQSNTPLTDVTRLVAELAAPQVPRPVADTLPALAPRLAFEPELLLRAQDIKVVFFDVDGVMTDGGLFFTEAGETIKRFNALDGHGIKMLQRVGITPAVVTGRDSAPLRKRLAALGVTHVRYGTEDKRPAAESILADLGLTWQQAAAMGDDWPDAPVLRRVALACAPRTAHIEILGLGPLCARRRSWAWRGACRV